MKYVSDTGAAISLASSQFSDLLFREFNIVLTPTVVQELRDFEKYSDFLGQKAGEVLKRGLKVEKAEKIVNLNLSQADGEVFSLATEKKYLPITDDLHAARVIQSKLAQKSYPSFYLLLLLYKMHGIFHRFRTGGVKLRTLTGHGGKFRHSKGNRPERSEHPTGL